MGNVSKVDFINGGKKVDEEVEEKKTYVDKETTENKELIDTPLEEISDDELKKLVSNLSLSDREGRNLIFFNRDEAKIYGMQLMKNIPDIRFVRIIECYSMRFGAESFFQIEPMSTEYFANNAKVDGFQNDDFVVCPEGILAAIVELAKRENAKKKEENKEK
jgi:hypothetical protein